MNYEQVWVRVRGNAEEILIKLDKEIKPFAHQDYAPEEYQKISTQYFIASGLTSSQTGWEVLIFPADENGDFIVWSEVLNGTGLTHWEAIDAFIERITE